LQRNHPPDAAERLMERLEPETESAQRGITETASLSEAKTRHDLLLPESESASKPGAARAPALPPAAAAPAARGSKQKEASKMADMHQPRPPAPDPRRPPPPTARPAPNVFSVVPDDRPRPRPAMGPIGGLAPPRTDTGGGWIGLLLAIVVFAIGIALLAVTFVNPFFPLGF
jgi:hypothetical protein